MNKCILTFIYICSRSKEVQFFSSYYRPILYSRCAIFYAAFNLFTYWIPVFYLLLFVKYELLGLFFTKNMIKGGQYKNDNLTRLTDYIQIRFCIHAHLSSERNGHDNSLSNTRIHLRYCLMHSCGCQYESLGSEVWHWLILHQNKPLKR